MDGLIQVDENIVVSKDTQQYVVHATSAEVAKQLAALPEVYSDGDLFILPATTGACRLLYNLGYGGAIRATPFMFERHPLVEGKYQPMQHQLDTAAFMTMFWRGYCLSEPRLGKTSSTILALDYLRRCRVVAGAALIITTVTTMHGVWKEAVEASLPNERVVVAHGKDRLAALQTPADYYITNYDSCRLSRDAFMEAIKDGRINAIIIDELTHVGNSGSQRHKAIWELCNKSGIKYVWGLTGSPADNPEMVFGMCKTVNPAMLPCTTKSAWLGLTTVQWGAQPYQRGLSRDAANVIKKAMQPAIRFLKKDILDLPPVTTQVRECEMSREQLRLRAELMVEATALVQSGERITAANGGVLMGKIMQTALGIVKDDAGDPQALPHKPRTEAILDTIAETPNKVVVFCGYTAAIKLLVDEIRAAGYTCEMVDGSVTGKERARILEAFQNTPDPHVLVCHPTTTAMGVELSAADTIIFNGVPLTGGFVYAQSIERLSSTKQKASSINIIHIISTSEERKALARIQKGYDIGQLIAGLFQDFVSGTH